MFVSFVTYNQVKMSELSIVFEDKLNFLIKIF